MDRFEHPAPRQERKRPPAEILKDILRNQSRDTNELLRREGVLGNLLSHDAVLNPEGYEELYSKDALKADTDFVRERERDFSSAANPKVQAFYKDKYGTQTEEELIAKWRENKSAEKNGQMEMAITALLSQKLGSDFIVVRTAPYDDYKNGVDNLILDRITGEVIGAFDEVHEGGDGKRMEEKKKKVQKIAERGGAKIRYGLKLSEGKLARASLEGVPVFYLGLHSSELGELVEGLGAGDAMKTDIIFRKLLDSLETQHAELQHYRGASAFRRRLDSFGHSLGRLMKAEERRAA